jgi:hypothetical protein
MMKPTIRRCDAEDHSADNGEYILEMGPADTAVDRATNGHGKNNEDGMA